ncbi:MAG: hypothetical protein COA59_17630 [Colwellia sp.]|nr:MAG: hypothetical protein COA59_17630 [Colwellia sp.]
MGKGAALTFARNNKNEVMNLFEWQITSLYSSIYPATISVYFANHMSEIITSNSATIFLLKIINALNFNFRT